MAHRFYMVILTLALGTASPAVAYNTAEPTSDDVIYSKDDALWTIPAVGGESTVLVPLPWHSKEVKHLRVSADGTALILNAQGFTAWAAITRGQQSTLKFLPCSGTPAISTDGNHVICSTQDSNRIAVYQLRPVLDVVIYDYKTEGGVFLHGDNTPIVVGDDRKLMAISASAAPRILGPLPQYDMSITPDGSRAIGGWQDGSMQVVYSFALNGKGIKRTLMHAARSLDISANGRWAAIQQEVDACAVRISGGQYMCWRRYEAKTVSSRGRALLLSRVNKKLGHDLFVGTVSGTSAKQPRKLVQQVERTAIFWPGPHGPALPPPTPTKKRKETPAATDTAPGSSPEEALKANVEPANSAQPATDTTAAEPIPSPAADTNPPVATE